jgi:hypothetical protein
MDAELANEIVIGLRIVAVVIALPLSALVVALVRIGIKSGFDFPRPVFLSVFGTASALCWWFAIRGHIAEDRAVLISSLTGALIVGGIGFAGGFFGPMILAPKSNQGPLVGIFVTGPLGFVAGALIGLCIGIVRVSF